MNTLNVATLTERREARTQAFLAAVAAIDDAIANGARSGGVLTCPLCRTPGALQFTVSERHGKRRRRNVRAKCATPGCLELLT
jgi:hypothetical protein